MRATILAVRISEWLLVGYVVYLLAVAWIRPLGTRRRLTVTTAAIGQGLAVWWLSTARVGFGLVARDWLPALHLLIGYWLSGAFFERPMPGVESALARWDRTIFGATGLDKLIRRGPRWILEYLELAYLGVYVITPLGFGVAYLWAPGLSVDAYWTVVLGAGLLCYGMLPWLQTRPPTALGLARDIEARGLRIRRLNVRILKRGSIRANTVPSGHASTAVATALAAGSVVPGALVPLLVVALSIAVASVVERYHYTADAVLGVIVAVGVWLLVHGLV